MLEAGRGHRGRHTGPWDQRARLFPTHRLCLCLNRENSRATRTGVGSCRPPDVCVGGVTQMSRHTRIIHIHM